VITLTTVKWAPPFAQGLVRDIRVRWALEEAGLPYRVKLVGQDDRRTEDYRARQPFGQVPVYEEDGVEIFESGAIVHHVAERSEALMPRDARGRARTLTWMFAALNSIEPAVLNLVEVDIFSAQAEWAKPRRPAVVAFLNGRLECLSKSLGEKEYLEGHFTAGDVMMTTVLRIARHTELVEAFPNLLAYKARCEARAAFAKALADQMKVFAENAPPR
jgi:glutathione S-transferase